MVIKKEIPELNYLVRQLIVDETFHGLSPIVAGGSILFLYRLVTDGSYAQKKKVYAQLNACKIIEKIYNAPEKMYLSSRNLFKDGLGAHTGDVDIWFSSEEEQKQFFSREGIPNTPVGESGWALTLNVSKPKNFALPAFNNFQIIKRYYSSPEELISEFDFVNCSIAWKDDVLYLDDRLDDAFSNMELLYNKNPIDDKTSIASKIFNVLRAFKYNDKYCLNFSEEISKFVFDTIMEAEDLDLSKYEERLIFIQNNYGKKYTNSNGIRSMISMITPSCFASWVSMPSFKDEYLLYMIGLKSKHMSGLFNMTQAILDKSVSHKVLTCDVPF